MIISQEIFLIIGFYSFSEFAPRPYTKDNVLQYQTMTIGYLT